MTEYLQVSCAQCLRILKVRLEYVGHEVACNHCGQTFLATSREPRVLQFLLQRGGPGTLVGNARSQAAEEVASALLLPDPGQAQQRSDKEAALSNELEQSRLQIAAVRAELDAAVHELERVGQERAQLATVQAEMEQWRREAEGREEQLRTELAAVQNQIASDRQHQEQELLALGQKFEEQRQHLQDQVGRLTGQAKELQQERQTLASQLKHFREQATALDRDLDLLMQERDRAIRERDLSDRARRTIEGQWQATVTQLNQAIAQSQSRDECHQQQHRALTEQQHALSAQLNELRIRATGLESSLATATQELDQARRRGESERQQASDRLALEQSRHDDARRQWQEQIASLERQFLQEQQRLAIELDRVRDESGQLRAEREALLHQLDAQQQDCQGLAADANEVVEARKMQRRSLVKIARLTRSLERAWQRIELLRTRNQELATHVTGKPDETRAITGVRKTLEAT